MSSVLQYASQFSGTSPNTLSFPNGVTAGSMLVAYTFSINPGTVGVSDNINGTYTGNVVSGPRGIYTFPNASSSSGVNSTTVSMTFTSTNLFLIIEEWAGVLAVSPFDKSNTNSGSSNTTGTTGSTGTLTQANELILALMVTSTVSTGLAAQSPFTPGPAGEISHSGDGAGATGYQIVAATTAQNATFDWTTTSNWQAVIATYKIPNPGTGSVPTFTLYGLQPTFAQ
jgi:hypothetical protein